jgi:hypothetical protein
MCMLFDDRIERTERPELRVVVNIAGRNDEYITLERLAAEV